MCNCIQRERTLFSRTSHRTENYACARDEHDFSVPQTPPSAATITTTISANIVFIVSNIIYSILFVLLLIWPNGENCLAFIFIRFGLYCMYIIHIEFHHFATAGLPYRLIVFESCSSGIIEH